MSDKDRYVDASRTGADRDQYTKGAVAQEIPFVVPQMPATDEYPDLDDPVG